jgi:folate-dependent phosphoribosylglycinamide formyltransferase PurN
MKIILLTTDYNFAANVCIRTFLRNTLRRKYGIEVVGMVATTMFHPFEKKSWQRMFRFIKQSGFRFACKSIATNIIHNVRLSLARYFVADRKREFFTFGELAHRYHFPIFSTHDVNAPEVQQFIQNQRPDYLVSALLLQILKKEILAIPRKGSINFHPALFQEHRGVFSSFWALMRNKKKSGATVHFMDEKLDNGKIILQRNFFLHPSDSIHSVNEKSARLGGNLLIKALVKLKRKRAKTYWIKKMEQLFPMPNKDHTTEFERKGKKIIHWEDFFRI